MPQSSILGTSLLFINKRKKFCFTPVFTTKAWKGPMRPAHTTALALPVTASGARKGAVQGALQAPRFLKGQALSSGSGAGRPWTFPLHPPPPPAASARSNRGRGVSHSLAPMPGARSPSHLRSPPHRFNIKAHFRPCQPAHTATCLFILS